MEEGITIENFIARAIDDKLTLEIVYAKNSFDQSKRIISDISENSEYGWGYISAFCHMRNEQRTFKISRIIDARIVPSKHKSQMIVEHDYQFNPNKTIFNLYGERY